MNQNCLVEDKQNKIDCMAAVNNRSDEKGYVRELSLTEMGSVSGGEISCKIKDIGIVCTF
jgi:hypothetical protein